MPTWLILAKGPVFRFAVAFSLLGLLRLALLSLLDMAVSIRRAGDQHIPYRSLIRETFTWLFPVARLHRARQVYSYASFALHLGILFAGIFLVNHLEIFKANTGLSWPVIAKPILDILTLVTIFAGGYLLLYRTYVRSSRRLSEWMDYLLLLILLGIFLSGYVAGRPWNPIPYDHLMLFHTLSGILLLVLVPFTKIAHCVLFPLIRLSSEIAWHFTPRGGSETIQTLYGPEGRKI